MEENEKNTYQARLLATRLQKNLKALRKWARKSGVSCYRIYDKDIPEIPLACDAYTFLPDNVTDKESAAVYWGHLCDEISKNSAESRELLGKESRNTYLTMYLYERPYEKPEDEEERWLLEMKKAAAETMGIPLENVVSKIRRRQNDSNDKNLGKRKQYTKNDGHEEIGGLVLEQGQVFRINLSDYIDCGLFFDHRPLRSEIRSISEGRRVLNLFCYTGSFSVYAAEGKAEFVESIDMSRTYLNWAQENFRLNGFNDEEKYRFSNGDVVHILKDRISAGEKFDIIILDPPTFSNSKKTDTMLDINRDWASLIKDCTDLLSGDGILYFSTNSRRIIFDKEKLAAGIEAEEITSRTIPEDYRNQKIHRVWKITSRNSLSY